MILRLLDKLYEENSSLYDVILLDYINRPVNALWIIHLNSFKAWIILLVYAEEFVKYEVVHV